MIGRRVHNSVSVRLHRRSFLRGTGAAALSLPMLEAMTAGNSQAADSLDAPPKRFVAICASLGFHAPFLFPSSPGKNYELTPYLSELKQHRDKLTVLSGLSHPMQQGNNGHASELTWLTSAMHPGLAGFRNTISIDQLIASKIGLETRMPSLVLSTSGRGISWTSTGVEIPGISSPSKLFTELFIEGSPAEKAAEIASVQRGRSILDTVMSRANKMHRDLGGADREKLEEYVTSVRDLESRLQQNEGWFSKAKPKVESELPKDVQDKADAIAKQRLLYDMIVLALQTDSTRTVTLQLSGMNAVPKIPGVGSDWHGLSHHGKDESKIEELKIIEQAEFQVFGEFLTKLASVQEGDRSLLDSTHVLFGSNLGNASAHDWRNLPIILAGGDFEHGSYVAGAPNDNTPLANLFVSIAQQMGLEIDQFGSSTASSIPGLTV